MGSRRSPPGLLASLAALVASVGLVGVIASLGAGFNVEALATWYPDLPKSNLTPPNFVFPVVWTSLYAIMAYAAFRVWRASGLVGAPGALGLYLVQLALNLAWSYLFFAEKAFGAALAEIALLFIVIILTIWRFAAHDRVAAALLVPYALWVAFASYLNFEIVRLNG